jgi:hypothetical protein
MQQQVGHEEAEHDEHAAEQNAKGHRVSADPQTG